MQDPYSAMMSSQQRPDPYKVFNRQGSNPNQTESSSSVPNFYQGLQNYGPYTNSHDMYQPMTMTSNMSGSGTNDYTPLPAHMGTNPNPLSVSNGLSRMNPTTHTITQSGASSLTSSPPNRDMNMSNMSSPGPSTSRLSMSPDGPSQGQQHSSQAQVSSTHSPGEIVKTESSDSNSVKSGNEEDPGIPPKKRALQVPNEQRDDSYWEKRKKNNESAKRSREARRMKEEQIALRVVYLEQENLQLRTEVSLLKSEIEKLRCMLYNS